MSTRFPSGLVAEMRKIRGGEIAALAEAADGGGKADPFSSLLSACWLRTVETGPYPFVVAGDARPDFKRLMKGDLIFGLLELRRLSLRDGDDFEFDAQCEACRAKIPWRLSLSDLPVRIIAPEAAERLLRGEPLRTSLEDFEGQTREVRFRPQTLEQEDEIAKLMRQQKRKKATVIDVLAGQVQHIDGVNGDIAARHKFLATMGLGELEDLRLRIEAQDCGVETAVDVVCGSCQWEQTVNLPLDRKLLSQRRKPATQTAPAEGSSGASSPA